MILSTSNKEVVLKPTTKKIVKITEKYKETNLNELYFKALNNNDLNVFANILLELTEDKKIFNNDINQVYDFIDEWKKENNKSYADLFKEVAEMINNEGFFLKKMTEDELEKSMNNPLMGFDFNKVMKSSTEKVMSEIVANEMAKTEETEFKGYKG